MSCADMVIRAFDKTIMLTSARALRSQFNLILASLRLATNENRVIDSETLGWITYRISLYSARLLPHANWTPKLTDEHALFFVPSCKCFLWTAADGAYSICKVGITLWIVHGEKMRSCGSIWLQQRRGIDEKVQLPNVRNVFLFAVGSISRILVTSSCSVSRRCVRNTSNFLCWVTRERAMPRCDWRTPACGPSRPCLGLQRLLQYFAFDRFFVVI